jgi:molybdopterin-guanine dinucleotide biosynthesis protein A
MPFLSAGLIRRLARRFREMGCEVLLPRVGEELEPLHALYHRRLLGRMERLLADGQGSSVRRLFPEARTEYLQLPDTARVRRIFTNLNTPEDVRRLCAD